MNVASGDVAPAEAQGEHSNEMKFNGVAEKVSPLHLACARQIALGQPLVTLWFLKRSRLCLMLYAAAAHSINASSCPCLVAHHPLRAGLLAGGPDSDAMQPGADAACIASTVLALSNPLLVMSILQELGLQDLCAAASVCKEWHALANSEEFWREVTFERRSIQRRQVRPVGPGQGGLGMRCSNQVACVQHPARAHRR